MYNLKINGCHYIMDPSKSTGAKPIDFQIHGCQAPVAPVLTPPLLYLRVFSETVQKVSKTCIFTKVEVISDIHSVRSKPEVKMSRFMGLVLTWGEGIRYRSGAALERVPRVPGTHKILKCIFWHPQNFEFY